MAMSIDGARGLMLQAQKEMQLCATPSTALVQALERVRNITAMVRAGGFDPANMASVMFLAAEAYKIQMQQQARMASLLNAIVQTTGRHQ